MPPETAASLRHRLRSVLSAGGVMLLVVALGLETCHDTHGHAEDLAAFMAAEAAGLADLVAHLATDAASDPGAREQLDHVLGLLASGTRVRYVLVSGPQGVLAATRGAEALAAAAPARPASGAVQEFTVHGAPILESGRTLDAPAAGLVRVGLDAGPLEAARRAATVRRRLHAGLLLAGMVTVSALVAAGQRQRSLDRQIARARRRLARHEEEARRQEKLVAMGALAAGVAHQLRNPLNSIHLLAQVLTDEQGLPPGVAERARRIRGEAERLETSIGQFLEFARPRRPVPREVDVAALVREVADLQAAVHSGAGTEIVGYAPAPARLVTDPDLVREILENLLRNAREAGASRVLASLVESRHHVEISVADDGAGVPEAERERIFDLYYTSRAEGTGLGLSLANQMAVSLGGTLTLAEGAGLAGRGARFVLHLPRGRTET